MSPCVKLWRERHVIVGVAVNEKLYAVLKEFGFPTTLVVVGLLFTPAHLASPITESKTLLEAHTKRDRKTRE